MAGAVAYVTNDRKDSGLVLGMSILENIALPSLRKLALGLEEALQAEKAMAHRYRTSLGIRSNGVHQAVETLSGGNQQKVVLAKCLETKPKILIARRADARRGRRRQA